MSIYASKVEELLTGYREKLAKQGELRRQLGEISATATASRNVVNAVSVALSK